MKNYFFLGPNRKSLIEFDSWVKRFFFELRIREIKIHCFFFKRRFLKSIYEHIVKSSNKTQITSDNSNLLMKLFLKIRFFKLYFQTNPS